MKRLITILFVLCAAGFVVGDNHAWEAEEGDWDFGLYTPRPNTQETPGYQWRLGIENRIEALGEKMDPDINELEDDGLLRISDVESVDIIMSTPDGELEFEVVGEEYRLTDDGIRTLAKSGRLCEVLGHQWRTPPSSPDGFELAIYVELPAGYEEQVCSICGKRRTRQLTEWKED